MDNLTDVGAERAVLAGLFQYGVDSYIEIAGIRFAIGNKVLKTFCAWPVTNEKSLPEVPP